MSDETRGLRLLCPRGCGAMLTVPVPSLAEVNEASEDAGLRNLDALVGRNVVGAVLVHCVYSCTAVADDHPVMHAAGAGPSGRAAFGEYPSTQPY